MIAVTKFSFLLHPQVRFAGERGWCGDPSHQPQSLPPDAVDTLLPVEPDHRGAGCHPAVQKLVGRRGLQAAQQRQRWKATAKRAAAVAHGHADPGAAAATVLATMRRARPQPHAAGHRVHLDAGQGRRSFRTQRRIQ